MHQRNRWIHSGKGFFGSLDVVIQVILNQWSVLGFSQRNAPLVYDRVLRYSLFVGGGGQGASVGGREGRKYPGPHCGIYAPFALLLFTFIFAFLLLNMYSLMRSWEIPEDPPGKYRFFVYKWTGLFKTKRMKRRFFWFITIKYRSSHNMTIAADNTSIPESTVL